jgi:D-methionine transport system substrate-binding protein
MKKTFAILLSILLLTGLLAGCGKASDKKIVIGASPTPHAEILEVAAEILKEKGYELEIREFTDYVLPNTTLNAKDIDANYFQHQPYLEKFNQEHNTRIIALGGIHYEPMGIYPGKTATLEDLPEGAKIAIPNDGTNEARALLLLEKAGLIKLKDGADLNATVLDIVENPKKLDILEVEAAQVAISLQDVDLGVLNGNYALGIGLNVVEDSLLREEGLDSPAGKFINVLAVHADDANREDLKALLEALKSEKVRQFIEEKYKGSVVPVPAE